MHTPKIQFNSKRCPGSVVVTLDGDFIALLIKNSNHKATRIQYGHWFALATTLDEDICRKIARVGFGPYEEVKQSLKRVLEEQS